MIPNGAAIRSPTGGGPDFRHDPNVARDSAGTPRPSAVEVRAELERILASRCFEQAARSSKLLAFRRRADAGRTRRPPQGLHDRDRGVRPSAGLRRAVGSARPCRSGPLAPPVDEYYADEGRDNPVRVELPRGSYTATSSYHPSPADVLLGPMPESTAEEHAAARNRRRWRRIRSVLIAAVVLGVLGVVMLQQRELSRLTTSQAPTARTRVARPGKPPIVVLPFEELGAEPTVAALAATLREEVLLLLDDPELFVIVTPGGGEAASGAVPPAERNADGYVLRGSVRAMARAIRDHGPARASPKPGGRFGARPTTSRSARWTSRRSNARSRGASRPSPSPTVRSSNRRSSACVRCRRPSYPCRLRIEVLRVSTRARRCTAWGCARLFRGCDKARAGLRRGVGVAIDTRGRARPSWLRASRGRARAARARRRAEPWTSTGRTCTRISRWPARNFSAAKTSAT